MTEEKFKILNHTYVPEHEVLDETAKEKLLKTYKISETQLPVISKNDVIVVELGAKRGDVIKITRNSLTAGKAVYYRIIK